MSHALASEINTLGGETAAATTPSATPSSSSSSPSSPSSPSSSSPSAELLNDILVGAASSSAGSLLATTLGRVLLRNKAKVLLAPALLKAAVVGGALGAAYYASTHPDEIRAMLKDVKQSQIR